MNNLINPQVNSSTVNTISKYIKSQSRNKIIVYTGDHWELKPFNVGWHLSEHFHNLKESVKLPMMFSNKLFEMLQQAIYIHPEFGKILAITNVGILLEPEIKMDFSALLDSYSQNNTLFLKWPGESDTDNLYFLTKEQGIKIFIGNLSHIKI